jgi:uncharacterized protein
VIDPLFSLSGFFVGMIVGVTGVGGGSLMTPLLILLFGVHPSTAIGTDLLFAAATKTAGSAVHGIHKSIDWGVLLLLASGSVPGAFISLWVLSISSLDMEGLARGLSLILGAMLLITALTIVFRERLLKLAMTSRVRPRSESVVSTILFGFIIGVLVSIASIGAGAVGVTVLMMIYPRMPLLRIVATDIAHAVPLTLVAGVGHWAIGNVEWMMLVSLLLGSIPGILIASHYAPRVPEPFIRWTLSTVLAIVGARLLFT